MLQLNVSQLVRGTIGSKKEIELDDDPEINEMQVGHVTGKLTLTKTNRSILVKGHINTSVMLECARCLKQYNQIMSFDVEDEYSISNNVKMMALEAMGYYGDDISNDDEDDETLVIDERMQMDLTELVRQYIVMNIPMKPLCDQNCQGII